MELLQEVTENKNMEKKSFFSTKVIIAFVIGIIIGFLGTWISMQEPADKVADADTDAEISETADEILDVALSGQNTILVRDQKAGIDVEVELVILESDSWVVIHEDNNGELGNALGARLFASGQNSGIVKLLRGMEEGREYYANIRKDDGDRAFDLTKDILLSDSKGNPVQVKFKATNGIFLEE